MLFPLAQLHVNSVQIIQEPKPGQRLLIFHVRWISQTIMHEEALPCTAQFRNVWHDDKEHLGLWEVSDFSGRRSLWLWRQCSSYGSCIRTGRETSIRLPIPCLVYANFLVQSMYCTILSTDLLWYRFYNLCPLLRFKRHVPLTLKSTGALTLLSVLLSFDYSIKHKDTRTYIKITQILYII